MRARQYFNVSTRLQRFGLGNKGIGDEAVAQRLFAHRLVAAIGPGGPG
jgi:hypothetical protein